MTTELQRSPRLRFSLSELLGVTALLAAGFTWPLLLVFIVPLVAVAGLSRLRHGRVAPLIAVAALSLVLGVIFSQLYWRYPFVEPALLAELRDIKTVEQLSYVADLNPERLQQPTVRARHGIPRVHEPSWTSPGTDRVLQHLSANKIGIHSAEPLSSELLTSIWNAADKSDLLISGDPGYLETKTLDGYVGIARLSDDSRVAFATLLGREQSNDHYPYYEFVMNFDENDLSIINSQWFFVDIAGIEGMDWLSFAIMSFMVMVPLVIVLEIAWAIWAARNARRQDAYITENLE